MATIDVLRSLTPEVSGILKKGGYFGGVAKDLRHDTTTTRKLKAAIEAKNHRLLEDMWSNNPDMLSSLPQFQTCKENLNKTDLDRIQKEIRKKPKDQRTFERRIDRSYLTAPSRLERIERSEGHVSGLVKEQRKARKEKFKFKIWRNDANPCDMCKALEGQKRKINEPYSNGSYVAHAHPQCKCFDEYI